MTKDLSRRGFLAVAGGSLLLPAGGLSGCGAPAAAAPSGGRAGHPALDIHVHLFGSGDGGSGCRLSAAIRGGATYAALKLMLGVRDGDGLDLRCREILIGSVRRSGLDRAVVLAQDAAYDASGRADDARTHFFVPNDWVFDTCAADPDLLVPCPSINPDRRDAIDELERCVARGARILKIHPPTQGVDLAAPRHAPFFQRCAAHDVIVMVHTGHEHSAPIVDAQLADPLRLEQALAAGCRVVASHAGTGWESDRPDFLPHFVEMVRRHDNLWGDTAILCTPGRHRDVRRLLELDDVLGRLVHGSDFPFPPSPQAFADILGAERAGELARKLAEDRNILRCDLRLKEELGLAGSAERGYRLLFG